MKTEIITLLALIKDNLRDNDFKEKILKEIKHQLYPQPSTLSDEGIDKQVKDNLLIRGFNSDDLLNNRGLIGAVIDETKSVFLKSLPHSSVEVTDEMIKNILVNNIILSETYKETKRSPEILKREIESGLYDIALNSLKELRNKFPSPKVEPVDEKEIAIQAMNLILNEFLCKPNDEMKIQIKKFPDSDKISEYVNHYVKVLKYPVLYNGKGRDVSDETAKQIVEDNFKGLDELIEDKDLLRFYKDLIETCLIEYCYISPSKGEEKEEIYTCKKCKSEIGIEHEGFCPKCGNIE